MTSRFDTTRWSLVRSAARDDPVGRLALDELCRIYRPSVLAFLRRSGLPREAADEGELRSRTLMLEWDYGVTDRLAVTAWLPFKSNRYVGDSPHDPSRLLDPHGETLRDDGHFHNGWSDWGLGLRWLWRTEPVAITPFVSFHHPANDYPIYTITAFGTQQWRLDVGVNAGASVPGPIRNLYWQVGYAYSHMEKTRPNDSPDHRVNHSVLSARVGWLATPRLSATLGWRYRKAHHGLRMPEDFNRPFIDDLYYYHDQLFPLEQSVVELGLTYQINDRYSLHSGYGRTVHVAFGSEINRAVGFGVTRSF